MSHMRIIMSHIIRKWDLKASQEASRKLESSKKIQKFKFVFKELTPTDYAIRFMKALINLSDSNIFAEAKTEWIFTGGIIYEEDSHCICGHQINNLYELAHKRTGKHIYIGSECVKKIDMANYLEAKESMKILKKIVSES